MANMRLSLQQFQNHGQQETLSATILDRSAHQDRTESRQESYADYCNLRATCRIMNEAGKSSEVLHSFSLSPLMKNPLNGYQHMAFLNKCLENDNCAANFVQGILTYFEEGDVENGMAYLNNVAIGEGEDDILEASYLYGVLRFLHGNPLEGPFEEIAFRYWREDEEDLVAQVWKNLRRILHEISVDKKPVYMQTLRSRPPGSCYLQDLEIEFRDCFSAVVLVF